MFTPLSPLNGVPAAGQAVPCEASAGVVEDDSQHVPLAGVHSADAVAQLHAVIAAGASFGPVPDGKDHRLALARAGHHRSRLLARSLLDEHALPAGEVLVRPTEHDEQLEREGEVAVDVLVQAVVAPGP